jgi:hypothetical protein
LHLKVYISNLHIRIQLMTSETTNWDRHRLFNTKKMAAVLSVRTRRPRVLVQAPQPVPVIQTPLSVPVEPMTPEVCLWSPKHALLPPPPKRHKALHLPPLTYTSHCFIVYICWMNSCRRWSNWSGHSCNHQLQGS